MTILIAKFDLNVDILIDIILFRQAISFAIFIGWGNKNPDLNWTSIFHLGGIIAQTQTNTIKVSLL